MRVAKDNAPGKYNVAGKARQFAKRKESNIIVTPRIRRR